MTGYTLYTRDDLATRRFSEQCKTALTATITCPELMSQWTSPGYRGSLGNATLQNEVCHVGCRDSLASWYRGVVTRCADYTWSSGGPLEMAGGYTWDGYNESCQIDPSTGRYCNDVIDAFSDSDTLDNMPDGELCSRCFSGRVQMMQKSTYSIFNTVPWYQKALQAIKTRCKVQVPTDVPPALIVVPKAKPFCVSDKYYTTKAGDTCNSIAMANSVSSANVFYAAAAAGAVGGCFNLPVNLAICLPLTCTTYLVKPTDDCLTASVSAGVDDITKYNTWIDLGCDNLHEANATLGSLLCTSPLGGTYIPGKPTNTSHIPHGGLMNYSSIAVDPPSGATVAPRTALSCGRWYVAQKGDTCAFITATFSIGLSLFTSTNPSIDTTASGGCSASIVAGYAYCVSPVFNPYYRPKNRTYTTKPFGCWSNLNTTTQPLTGPIWTGRDMTLDTCAKACSTDGFTFTGLRGNDTCLCGNQVAMNSVQLSTSACTAINGGAFSLYGLSDDATLSFQFRDVGCFSNSALITGSAPSITWATNNTVRDCSTFCLPAYPYFGLVNGDMCRCGTGIYKALKPVDTDENCNVACTGRKSTNCGAADATLTSTIEIDHIDHIEHMGEIIARTGINIIYCAKSRGIQAQIVLSYRLHRQCL